MHFQPIILCLTKKKKRNKSNSAFFNSVPFEIPDDELRARWDNLRSDYNPGISYGSTRYSIQEFPHLDEKTRDRLLVRHDVLPENLEVHLQCYSEHVEPPLNEFLSRCPPASVIRLDGSLDPNNLAEVSENVCVNL